MKRENWILLILILVITVLVIALPGKASAGDVLPVGVEIFWIDTGHTCVIYEGEFECYCPCEIADCEKGPDPTDKPDTPKPTDPTDIPEPTETPEPTKKPKCNAGRGNGSEYYWDGEKWVDCDPGNSYKNKGGD